MNDFFHHGLHGAQSQLHDVKTVKYGRISSYDPDKHAVKVILEQDAVADDESEESSDKAAETEWIPLGTLAVGEHWGLQYAPKGGASADEPDKGELCLVNIIQRSTGLFYTAHLVYDSVMLPPGAEEEEEEEQEGDEEQEEEEENEDGQDDDPKGRKRLEGGELIFRHESGSFLKFYKNGDIQIFSSRNLYAYVKEKAEVVVRKGDLDVTVEKGDMNVLLKEGDLDVHLEKGDMDIHLDEGDATLEIDEGNLTATVKQNVELTVEEGDVTVEVQQGSLAATVQKDAALQVTEGDLSVDVLQGNATVSVAEGDLDVKVEVGNTTIDTVAGDTSISSIAGSIIATTEGGDIGISTTSGSIVIDAGMDVTVIATGVVNLFAPLVNAGIESGLFQTLCNEAFLALFNGHTHPDPVSGSTGPPTTPAVPGLDTTTSFAAN